MYYYVCSPNLQVWSILDGSDPKKKSKNKMAIFILFENVTTFYTNIFWYVQPLRIFFCRKTLTQTDRQRRSNSSLDTNLAETVEGVKILVVNRNSLAMKG